MTFSKFLLALKFSGRGLKNRSTLVFAVPLILLMLLSMQSVAVAQSDPAEVLLDFEIYADQAHSPFVPFEADDPVVNGLVTISGGYLGADGLINDGVYYYTYGSAGPVCVGCEPVITLDFAEPVSNVSLDVMNAWETMDFIVRDDQGNEETVNVLARWEGDGVARVELLYQNIVQVTVRTAIPQYADNGTEVWSFGIDNLRYLGSPVYVIEVSGMLPHNFQPGPIFDRCYINPMWSEWPWPLAPLDEPEHTFEPTSPLVYGADDREAQPYVKRQGLPSRNRQTIVLKQGSDGNFEILPGSDRKGHVGESRAYASLTAMSDGMLNSADIDAVLNDCHLLHKRGRYTNKYMFIEVDQVGSNVVNVLFKGDVKLPITPEKLTPATTWNFTVTLDLSSEVKRYSIVGFHDRMPAYSIYINEQLVYGLIEPGPRPYDPVQGARYMNDIDQANVNEIYEILD